MDDSCELFVLYKQYPSGGKIWLMLGLETTGSDYDDILGKLKNGFIVSNVWIYDGLGVRLLYTVFF